MRTTPPLLSNIVSEMFTQCTSVVPADCPQWYDQISDVCFHVERVRTRALYTMPEMHSCLKYNISLKMAAYGVHNVHGCKCYGGAFKGMLLKIRETVSVRNARDVKGLGYTPKVIIVQQHACVFYSSLKQSNYSLQGIKEQHSILFCIHLPIYKDYEFL